MSQGFHHIHRKKHVAKHTALGKLFDKSMYVIALISPLMTIPQLYDVWTLHHKASVSVATWSAYTLTASFWVIYGILHKEKLITLVNFLLLILDGAIVIGVLFLH